MTNHLTSRAHRLIEEFEEGEDVRHGLAKVLIHLANAWYSYSDDGTLQGVRGVVLEDLAEELTAPTLLDRALAGDKAAAIQFLQDLGMIDEHGRLTGIYAPEPINQEDYDR
jgi:hypothetical protein